MKTPVFGPHALLLAVLLVLPCSVHAQYMYLDSNGDGVHTSADVLHGAGPTVVDIWLDTAHNRDGSATRCAPNPAQPLNVFSYQVALEATDGTVAFSPFTNRIAGFSPVYSGRSDSSRFDTGAFFTPPGIVFPPGRYLLGTFTVNAVGGTPSIRVVPTVWNAPFTAYTEFGSFCDGTLYPNTIAFEVDWFDADGLAYQAGGGGNHIPSLSPLANMTVLSGENATQVITATDADRQPLTFAKASGPAFLFVQTTDVGSGTATGEIRRAPRPPDVGTYTASVSVSDGTDTDQASFGITVSTSPNHAPTFLTNPSMSVMAGRVARRVLSAGDPDGSALHFAMVSGPAYALVTDLISGPGGGSAVLQASPTLCDLGSTTARVSVSDGVGQTTEDVAVRVLPPSPPPSSPLHVTPNAGLAWASQVADLNRDGRPDVVVGYENRSEITVLLGQGDGNLSPGVSYGIGGTSLDLVLGDFDRNGTTDVAVPDAGGHLNVLLGRGDGTLVPAVSYPIGPGVESIASADMNGDGILDLICPNPEEGTVSVLLGAGDGTFRSRRDSTAGLRPRRLAVADFNLDGRPDVAIALDLPSGQPDLVVLPGLGDGTFGTPIPTAFSGFVISLVTGDWNGDSKPDLALTDLRNNVTCTFLGQGDGTFSPATTLVASPAPYALATDDLNGDGNTDLVAADLDSTRIFFGTGTGGFVKALSFGGFVGQYIALGDLNSDGRPDMVSADGSVVMVRLNTFAAGIAAAEARAFVSRSHQGGFEGAFGGEDRDGIEIRLEPIQGSYTNEQVDLSSVTLSSAGTGSLSQIHSIVPRSLIVADTDRNGIAEIGITFTRSVFDALFDRILRTTTVVAELRGSLLDSRAFCAGVELKVKKGGLSLPVVFAPNPLNPRSKLTFTTTRPGGAKAQLFDIHGRLVRTLLDVARLEAGNHEVGFDGRNARGVPLSSGVLFYRLTSVEGTFEGRLVILK